MLTLTFRWEHPQVCDSVSNTRTTPISSSFQVEINSRRINTLPHQTEHQWHGLNWQRKFYDPLFVLNPLAQEFQTVCKATTFCVFSFLISHNRGILVSFKIKIKNKQQNLEIKDNLSCYCLSVKDIIFGRQIPWTVLTVQITVGSVQRMKINFSFPKGVSTHGHIKLKGLKQKIPFTSSWCNSYDLKEIFWNTSRLHAVMHGGLQTQL